jgi:hypothetical protein
MVSQYEYANRVLDAPILVSVQQMHGEIPGQRTNRDEKPVELVFPVIHTAGCCDYNRETLRADFGSHNGHHTGQGLAKS